MLDLLLIIKFNIIRCDRSIYNYIRINITCNINIMRSDNQLAFFKKFHQNIKYHFISNNIFTNYYKYFLIYKYKKYKI